MTKAIEADEEEKEEKKSKGSKSPASKLQKPVQDLMNFIFDLKMIEKSVMEVGFDPKKMPLGHLSDDQISDGFKILKKIE